MGSLMAGWDSHVHNLKDVKLQRNRSLTNERIEEYWNLKKKNEEDHLKALSALSPTKQEEIYKESEKRYERSSSLPPFNTEGMDTEESVEKLIQKNGWWISSNSAFLNEPPVIVSEGPTHKYASQYHVAHVAHSKPDTTGISA